MQKPVEGLSVLRVFSAKHILKKSGGEGLEKAVGTYLKA